MARTVSGQEAVKILVKFFGFQIVGQKGSHIKLKKLSSAGTITTIVPNHKELAHGTLKGVLKLAKVGEEDFLEKNNV